MVIERTTEQKTPCLYRKGRARKERCNRGVGATKPEIWPWPCGSTAGLARGRKALEHRARASQCAQGEGEECEAEGTNGNGKEGVAMLTQGEGEEGEAVGTKGEGE